MKKGLRILFIFALLITLVACGDREIPTFDDILNQTVDVGSDAIDWESYLENLSDNETSVDALVIEVDDKVNYNVPGTYNVTITVTDESDNAASVTFTVTVVDRVKPVITLIGESSASIIAGGSFTDPGATYFDNVDGTGTATVSGTVNTQVAGTYTLTYNYTDAAGNVANPVTRTVTVIPLDTQAPVITLTGAATITVEAGSTFADPGATFSDNLDGTGAAIASGTVNTAALGTYTLTYNYTDAQGNAATPVTRTVNVVDTTAPVITVAQATYTIEVGSTFTLPTATASDNLDADATVTATGTVNTSVVGSYTLTYNFTDSQGNAATAVTVTVVVADTTAPVVTLTGSATVTLEAGATFTDAGATATDNYDATSTVVVSGTVNNAALGTYTLTYTSTDASGNVGTATRTVTVVDTTSPVITVTGGANVTVQIGETYTELGATFTDNLDAAGNATVAASSDTVNTATVGTYTITYTVTDSAGNTATATRTVTVSDTPPRFSLIAKENYTLTVSSYFKYTNADVFVVRYMAANLPSITKLVVFNGATLVYEREYTFQLGRNFSGINNISENGFLLREYNIGFDRLENFTYNVVTNTITEVSLVGEIRSTGPITSKYLVDSDNYYYLVLSGENRGFYNFKNDLSLEKIVSIQGSYNNNYFPIEESPNSNLRIIEMNSNFSGVSYSELIIIDKTTNNVIKSFFYSNSIENPNVGEAGFYQGFLDDKLVIRGTVYGQNQVVKIYIYNADGTEFAIHEIVDWTMYSDYDPMGRNLKALHFTTKATADTNRKVFIYNNKFELILEDTLDQNITDDVYFDDQYAYYVKVAFQSNSSSLVAYPLDGSAAIVNTLPEFSATSGEWIYRGVNIDYDNSIRYIFGQSQMVNQEYVTNYFYIQDGVFKVFTSTYRNIDNFVYNETLDVFLITGAYDSWNNNFVLESKLRTIFVDQKNDTVVEIESDVLDFRAAYANFNQFAQSGNYAISILYDQNNYSALNIIVLYNLQTKTITMHEFDEPLLENRISSFTVDQDGKVTISLGYEYSSNRYTLTSTVSAFSTDMVVTTGGTGGTGGGTPPLSVYFIEDILAGLDLKITRTTGPFNPQSPPLNEFKIELNDQIFEYSVMDFSLYVVDLDGTDNDAIYLRLSSLTSSYFVNLLDPQLTQIFGTITAEGIFNVDQNFNETLDTRVKSTQQFNYFRFYVID
jgi:hypothetical protein